MNILERIKRYLFYSHARREAMKVGPKFAGKWIFIDLDSELDRDLLNGLVNSKTLCECEITFQIKNAGENETTASWLDALKCEDIKPPTIRFDESTGTIAIHFADTAQPGRWFFLAERVVLETISTQKGSNISEHEIVKHGRIRIPL